MTSPGHDDASGLAAAAALLGATARTRVGGRGALRSALPVTDLAVNALGLLGGAVAALVEATDLAGPREVVVHRGRAEAWCGQHVEPTGWALPSPWDPLSGSFPTRDGSWIRTHANAPRHRAALLSVTGCAPDADVAALTRAIAGWDALALEDAVVAAGGVAAALRSAGEWAATDAGRAVAAEPLIARQDGGAVVGSSGWRPSAEAPLAGIRVLDLTRVIAGPACTQALAALGADVLRVDPPAWDEPAVLPLVMAGKRTARLDARTPDGRARLTELMADADVLVHGYRPGALDALGFPREERERIRPGLVDVAVDAYGWTGPWAGRRGFDSIVQSASGIAHAGMVAAGSDRPVPLPVQALDWSTGYLAAASAVAGLARRAGTGRGSSWRLSLARTAHTLLALPRSAGQGDVDGIGDAEDKPPRLVTTPLGDARMTASPLRVGPASLSPTRIATMLGGDAPTWV
ncbi:CoA transferase [Clavibacter michiganensis]|uniref:CoA transferase n=1 Tax=Clavibacter michiganensis TaxID=28447 RepID=UPI0026DBE331|nr:CoA transferase [Clavibacter michiganensis]MDO4066170.1 CoA transferase [Clavibacter michiganensis]MDO4070634.1 CoA transferase [Clavibacter michiganensis]MDO4090548.1 CoA transferase [Clavibacter michiganensis]